MNRCFHIQERKQGVQDMSLYTLNDDNYLFIIYIIFQLNTRMYQVLDKLLY